VCAAFSLVLAACGHSGTASHGNVISCRAPDADRPTCNEDEPYNDDMRLVAISKCREAGGVAGTACPTVNLAGSCDRVYETPGKKRQSWEYSRRGRAYYYEVPGAAAGPLNLQQLRKECTEPPSGGTPGQWTDGKPAS
jgi:hypothetical protein